MKNEKNSVLFKTCHSLTAELVKNTSFDYRTTFSACLRLYHSNKSGFFAVCRAYNSISRFTISVLDNADFDFFSACENGDNDKIDSLLTFAVNYGLRIRESYASKKDYERISMDDFSTLDNSAPNIVKNMRKDDFSDLKNDCAIYLLNRADNEKFRSLPFIFQLLRAGDNTVTCAYAKICRETKALGIPASLDEMKKNGIEYSVTDEYEKLTAKDITDRIVSKLPKAHRENGKKIIELRYVKKAMLIDDIAQEMGISVRTVKTIIAEIKAMNVNEITG